MSWPYAAIPGLLVFFAAIVLGNVEAVAIFAGWPAVLRLGPVVARVRRVGPVVASIPVGSVKKNPRVIVKRVDRARAFLRPRILRGINYVGEVAWDAAEVNATARWPLSYVLGVVGFGLVLAAPAAAGLARGNASGVAGLAAFVLIVGALSYLRLQAARRQFEED